MSGSCYDNAISPTCSCHPIKVSYISFGSLQTKAVNEKHPDRTLMSLEKVCNVIESVLKQDEDSLISEYRIDPIQKNNN